MSDATDPESEDWELIAAAEGSGESEESVSSDPTPLSEHVGRRIEVKWSSGRYYRGTVTDCDGDKHKVVYDDGDVRWYHLPEMVMRFVDEQEEYHLVRSEEAVLTAEETVDAA